MKKTMLSGILAVLSILPAFAQPDRWQQEIHYNIGVAVNVGTNRFTGTEKIDYFNNSPDTLSRVFFHLYWNAFQPNSMMDIRSREAGKIVDGYDKKGNEILDWDPRVKDRISKLQPDQIGYDSVSYIKIDGIAQKLIYHETILEVTLTHPILPHSKTSMELAFFAQVPIQIRRSGRDNAEGVRYSMSQWYPKMVEYDYQGWNANPYVGREFYGVWGDYTVNITIDKHYMLAGTGTLLNPDEVGFGYQATGVKVTPASGTTLTWKFYAHTVHDFVWAADTAYTMIRKQLLNGPLLYFVFKNNEANKISWQKLADTAALAYPYLKKTFGPYPYKNYSFIQGGDGGMEYPMATLLKSSGIEGAIHEWIHSWYQGMMGTNESLYPWMDEGFTSYGEARVIAWLRKDSAFPYKNAYNSYFRIIKSGKEEALSTHADHYNTNYAYEVGAYSKGAIFLAQLGYIVGDSVLDKILLEYYREWRFKHPNPNDFIRVAEKVSGIELQWYKQYWIYTTKTIDYAIGNINLVNDQTVVTLKRLGYMPMPLDVLITYKDGTREMYYIPMNLMYGQKPAEDAAIPRIVEPEWKWVAPEYQLVISRGIADIRQIEIDPSQRMADVNRINNKLTVPDTK